MLVEKRKSYSVCYRASLAQNIAKNGFVVMPCSWCVSQGLIYKIIAYIKCYKAYHELSKKLTRLRRLCQQKKFLVEKGADIVARGLSTLDELEAVKW
ncbi:hypothetical protein MYCTH_79143 [Thermothelomyces thermophilus ATCC 42464]|uniref:Uncharacterized protein n=1 Tax=Thermothelomyces thermophilus (strain ATCC 42464 / BCRC 31852 / DSM 1799) TaxID=573729 RepID=G2Q9G8_THET4|nr:uncharacterized protein MYCTH_79143 [Thermothelomyces thermophilus ATCC 42464]AEO56427.1 hypothetical protein MYCTH_79143 [Thermothelomyces thermophilus ATCC 42464]